MEEQTEKKKSTAKEIISMLVYVAIIVLVALFIVNFVGQRTIVSGSSMENTLSNGDNLIIDKISYRFTDPKRFEIVIFPDPEDPSKYFIKRIIGLPGETVQIEEDGTILINGEPLEEHYGRETILDPGIAADPITLRPGQYFVMGDNRNNSLDSRYPEVGPISGTKFIGRALCRIYPFNRIRGLLPKAD